MSIPLYFYQYRGIIVKRRYIWVNCIMFSPLSCKPARYFISSGFFSETGSTSLLLDGISELSMCWFGLFYCSSSEWRFANGKEREKLRESLFSAMEGRRASANAKARVYDEQNQKTWNRRWQSIREEVSSTTEEKEKYRYSLTL